MAILKANLETGTRWFSFRTKIGSETFLVKAAGIFQAADLVLDHVGHWATFTIRCNETGESFSNKN